MRIRHLFVALLCLCICTVAVVVADTLTLKDGTVLEGKVIPQGEKYWIKLADGSSRVVNKADVKKFEQGDVNPKPASDVPSVEAKSSLAGTGGFALVKSRADRVEAPLQAVQLWDKFIDSEPPKADLDAALAEKSNWEQLAKDNAEKIKGKWVSGVERKRIVKQAKSLVRDGVKELQEGQSVAGFKKLEEAIQVYPKSFEANFHLGLYYLRKSTIREGNAFDVKYLDKAVQTLEMTTKIAPKSSSAWSNLAIGYAFKKRYQDSIKTAYKAALMHESEGTVSNLMTAFVWAPAMRTQAWARPIWENAVLMSQRHGGGEKAGWAYVQPIEGEVPSGGPAGAAWSGSGFFVTSDGYIITNHHVATGDTTSEPLPNISFRIRMDDGSEKTAQLLAVDMAADIALMKIEPDAPVIPLKLANYLPPQGSRLMTLGYPSTGDDEHTLQVSDGTVKSVHEGDIHEVWMNLNTTHGNSGGPIVDSNNHMVAIVTAYRRSFNMDIFLGVSVPQIKRFLEKVGDKAPKLDYADMPDAPTEFDSEKLTSKARGSTVLVIAIKTD